MNVAITQDNITSGGRLAVIIEMVEVLNDLDIIPTIITFNMSLSKEDIGNRYGKSIDFKTIIVEYNIFKKLPEFNKLWFNLLTRKYTKNFDLFIDSNNTSFLMTSEKPVLSMIYYPRIDRVLRNSSIHNDKIELKLKTKIAWNIDKFLARKLYKRHKIGANHDIYTISEFSKEALVKRYHIDENKVKIIYPPIDIESYNSNKHRNRTVATIGRFIQSKNQLMQIKIAQKVPNLEFHIMGFADTTGNYYKDCEQYIKLNNINNVHLHPNISYNSMIEILESSKYFLHTMLNEPFGITTVQGIAAGCIPIVSNSGGQKEIVPLNQLRFNSIEQAIQILIDIEENEQQTLWHNLYQHIQQYQIINFNNKFKEIMKTKYLYPQH